MAQQANFTSVQGTNGKKGFHFSGYTEAGRQIKVWVPAEIISQLAENLKITDSPGHAGWHYNNPDNPAHPCTCYVCREGESSKYQGRKEILENRTIEYTTYEVGSEEGEVTDYKPLAEIPATSIDLLDLLSSPDFVRLEIVQEEGKVSYTAHDRPADYDQNEDGLDFLAHLSEEDFQGWLKAQVPEGHVVCQNCGNATDGSDLCCQRPALPKLPRDNSGPEPFDLLEVCDRCHGEGCWECEPSEGIWER